MQIWRGLGSPECRRPRTCFGSHVQLVRAGAHPLQPYGELLSPDRISQPNGLWPGLTGQKEQGHSPGFLFQEWVSSDVSGCKTQGGTQLKFIFNHASLLPCFLFFFLRKMDQASFPFSLSLSKTSEGYTTSILALPLEEKQFSFHRLQRQTRVRYTGPHLRVRHWWAPSQQEQQRRGRPSIGLLPDAPPTTVVMST